jgi:hypothetical protein
MSEHDFSVDTREEWEAALLKQVAYFTTAEFQADKLGYVPKVHATFLEAYEYAKGKTRILIYAVTKLEHSVCIPQEKWDEYAGVKEAEHKVLPKDRTCQKCGKIRGTKLLMGAYWHPSCWRTSRLRS